MKLISSRLRRLAGFTLVEVLMATGASSIVLAGLVAGSVALQRSWMAVTDYANAENDQMRISDYLSVDMRRAVTVTPDGTGGVTVVLPNYYNSDGTPKTPSVVQQMGWPPGAKKHGHHKHKNIIVDQASTYDSGVTKTVKYYKGSSATIGKDTSILYRETGGVATPIATDVADFNVTITDDDVLAKTQITFSPRFRTGVNSTATAGTTYYQTTLLRNLQ